MFSKDFGHIQNTVHLKFSKHHHFADKKKECDNFHYDFLGGRV